MTKRKKWMLFGAGALTVAAVGWFVLNPSATVTAMTQPAARGNLAQTVEVTGEVRSVNDVDLAFDASGTTAFVGARVGDTVATGEVLAALRSDELEAAMMQAEQAVRQAEAELAVRRVGASAETVAVTEADVAVALAAFAAAETDAGQTKTVREAAVVDAREDLAQAVSNAADNAADAREDAVESVRSLVAEVRHALAEADTVLGIENSLYNREFDDVLGNEDAQSVIDATRAFEVAMLSRDASEDALLALDASGAADVSSVAATAYESYEDAYAVLLTTTRLLDATSADSVELSLAELTAFKSSVAAAQSSLVADGTALTNARQAYANAVRAATEDVTTAENALSTALAERDRAVAQSEAAATSRAADLARAEASLAELVASPRAVDLASFEAAVARAEADAYAALARLNKSQIVAPFAGVITSVAVDFGESASAGTPVITLRSAGEQFEITIDLPEADVTKVRAGQTADVTFDALGDDLAFAATVTSVDPAEKLIEGVVFYEAKVLLDEGADLAGVKPGMSATVVILTAERTDVVVVPTRVILEKDGVKYVRVPLEAGGFEERAVTVGLRADEGKTEITGGLSEGEVVIVSLKAL